MIRGVDTISRSSSNHDQSNLTAANIMCNQSSCSSLTSGLGQSDQSICNEQVVNVPNHNDDNTSATSVCDIESHTMQAKSPSSSSHVDSTESLQNDLNKTDAALSAHNSTFAVGDSKLRYDIKTFVDLIFKDSQSISLEKKSEFGRLMRSTNARLLFAMYVDDYRVNGKQVSELTFFSLAQYFSIVLLECLLAEDFRPAKILMTMMFTYYHITSNQTSPCINGNSSDKQSSQDYQPEQDQSKTYLYNLLKEQKIFHSPRFWTSAFYESVVIERNNHSVFVDRGPGKMSNEKRNEASDCSKNITFGLLGSFIHNMCLLGLSSEFCQEFLDKHSTIADLTDEQLELLRTNLKIMFKKPVCGSQSRSTQSATSEKLSQFFQKLSAKLQHSSSSSTSSLNVHNRL